MTKSDRYNLIVTLQAVQLIKRGKRLMSGFLPVTRKEVRDTIREETTTSRAASNDSTLADESEEPFNSSLPFAAPSEFAPNVGESSILLNAKERRQLSNDLALYRATNHAALPGHV